MICICKDDVLSDLKVQNKYTYNIDLPELKQEIHILQVKRVLIDYYHDHKMCHMTDHINQLILGIPHCMISIKLESKGYGIWARQSWTLTQLTTFALITQD